MSETTKNPLLAHDGLPAYSKIRAEHVAEALETTLAEAREAIARLESVETPDLAWLASMEDVYESVNRVWSPVSHLNSVASSPAMREAYNAGLPLISEFYTDIGQNERLYGQYLKLEHAFGQDRETEAQIVRHAIRDFRLGGVALEPDKRARYKELSRELSRLQAQFEQNVMDATDAFEHHETEAEALKGLPELLLERARQAAKEKSRDGWLFALDPPTYQAIVTHAEAPELRKRYYTAWNTRASDQGPHAGQWNNGPLMEEILAHRLEAARLLGFNSYAEQSLATKMADNTQEVIDFLRDLARRSKPLGTAELQRLEQSAGRRLDPWDTPFFAERLRQSELDLAEEALRPYFPLDRVLDGLFALAGKLFGIRLVREDDADTWHADVRYYRLEQLDGTPIGGLFTDFFARPNKRGGAWMDVCINRSGLRSDTQLPVAQLVCNFGSPVGSTPSLLTHGEVLTLFHEFGHTLHHLLTRVSYPSLAGINGVAWDAVELPSQFLENFAFVEEVLQNISGHYQTGEPLPDDTVRTLQRSRVFLAGLAMLRQLEFALFDFLLHDRREPTTHARLLALLADVQKEVAVLTPPSTNRFPNSFGHIFGGGYAAGYYSYKWAEVLAADAYSAFTEAGTFDAKTATRFRDSILAVGGSRDAIDAFRDFRGREPQLEPLLIQSGIPTAGVAGTANPA